MNNKRNLIISLIIILIIIFCVNYGNIRRIIHNSNHPQQVTENKTDISREKKYSLGDSSEKKYTLKIEKLNIVTPVVLDVNGADEEAYNKALEGGVAQMQGTAKPFEDGNIVIFGHSSESSKYQGDYGEIFSSLNNLEAGDDIKIIASGGDELIYKVETKEIVMPDDITILDQKNKNRLTLLTCWPIGSNEKRLVIIASQIKN